MTPRFIDKLEKKFGFLQIKNLPVYMVAGQAILYLAVFTNVIKVELICLVGSNVIKGDVIPLFIYPFVPPLTNMVIGFLFTLYITFFISKILENEWGSFKFTFYIFLSYIVVISISIIFPNHIIYNQWFLYKSIFIAFAYVMPNFVFHLLFLFPIKVKWLSLLIWFELIHTLIFGGSFGIWGQELAGEMMLTDYSIVMRLQALSAVLPFIVFFGKDLLVKIKQKKKRAEFASMVKEVDGEGRHRCAECKKTELTDPALEFRYKEMDGSLNCYCVDHVPKD